MQAFRRISGKLVCDFDDTERHVLCGLVISLIEVLLDAVPGCTGPGTDRITDTDDLFAQLERERCFLWRSESRSSAGAIVPRSLPG